MNLYFECNSGISGDMAVGALLDLIDNENIIYNALSSMKLDNEFQYKITKKMVNAISTTDFDVILPLHNHHEHRNLDDVNKIIDQANINQNAKNLAKKIFKIVAEAESKVHNKALSEVHFHEVGAIDSIADIVSFAVVYDYLKPDKTYFSTLTEGQGTITCQHGTLSVPVPAVCEIVSKYKIPIKITNNEGEMITPTGAAIVAALYTGEQLPEKIIIEKVGYGRGKRPYKNPILRVMKIN